MTKATIYTKDSCAYCMRAKTLLKGRNIPYDEKIVAVNGQDDRELADYQSWTTLDALLEKQPGVKTLPQIWLDNDYIGGYTELAEKLKQ